MMVFEHKIQALQFHLSSLSARSCHFLTSHSLRNPGRLLSTCSIPLTLLSWEFTAAPEFSNPASSSVLTWLDLLAAFDTENRSLVGSLFWHLWLHFYLVFFFCVSLSFFANCFTDVPPEILVSPGFCPWMSFHTTSCGIICLVIKFSIACIYVSVQICTFSSHFFLTSWLALSWVS